MLTFIAGTPLYAQDTAPQSAWTYHVRAAAEAATTRANVASPFVGPAIGSLWDAANQIVATGDATWSHGDRLQTGGGLAIVGGTGSSGVVRIRQGYARLSATSWLDVEGGKRLVRWGTGYAFTPTGLLDPPRAATDPQDRLGVNEGMPLAQATLFRGNTALTIAAAAPNDARRLVAAKLRTAVRGFEFAIVASSADDRRLSAGANFTHVVGDRLEWHGEWLVHDATSPWVARLNPMNAGARTMSALIGLQYTSAAGVNIVLEGYRHGNGLDHTMWQRLVSKDEPVAQDSPVGPAQAPDEHMPRPTRRDFVFVRAARAASDVRWKPELITIVGADDGSITVVPTSAWILRDRIDVYVRAVALTGARRSESRDAPMHATLTLGLAIRY